MKITVRTALPDDAQAVSMIKERSWKAAYVGMMPQAFLDSLDDSHSTKRFEKDISAGTLKVKLLLEDNTPAGMIGYGKSRDKKYPDWGEVVCLYVRSGFYRRGYGEKLLRAAQEDLAQEGFQDGFLWVLKQNQNARQFYSAMGLRETGDVTHSELMGETLTEVRYCFSLNLGKGRKNQSLFG